MKSVQPATSLNDLNAYTTGERAFTIAELKKYFRIAVNLIPLGTLLSG
ncbi:MAG: hypothetical protein WD431_22620 [Cyclobacteriaceae bacterium]